MKTVKRELPAPEPKFVQVPKLKKVTLIYCLACGVNPVDAIGGYEICPDCIGKL